MRVHYLWLLVVFLVTATRAVEEEETVEEEEGPIVEAEKFIPSPFVTPYLDDGSPAPLLFDYFPAGSKIGDRWIASQAKKDDVEATIAKYNGIWAIEQPEEVTVENDHGLVVKTKARHHAIAAKLDTPFKFADEEPLVVQYSVKYQDGMECGGGYLKLLSEGAEKNLEEFQDKTPYTIMFGPDKCGINKKVHLIFKYRNPINGSIDEYHAKQPANIASNYWDDKKTHLYTLVFKPSGEFAVRVDERSLFYGNVLSDVVPSLTPPQQIADPEDKKPDDWDEREEIDDETASKPEDWDESQPSHVIDSAAVKPEDWLESESPLIPDPEAAKPDDWDTDMDGEWEPPRIDNPVCKGLSGCGTWSAPKIANPLFKGKWIRPRIKNPAFRGTWTARLIDNPNYFTPTPFSGLAPITAVGLELWTMNEKIMFDDILITTSEETATTIAIQTFREKVSSEARLEATKKSDEGIIKSVIDAANERPWLWVVYVLAVIIPIIFIGVICFGRKSAPTAPPSTYSSAKTLAPTEEKNELRPSSSKEDQEDEGESGSDEDEVPEEVAENEPIQPTEEIAKPKASEGPTKRRAARRGD